MRRPSGVSTALILTPEAPYPITGGGSLRTASLVEYFRSRNVDLHVITWQEPGASDPRAAFPSDIRVDVLELPFHNRGKLAKAARNLGRFARSVPPLTDRFRGFERQLTDLIRGRSWDVALFEHFWVAEYGRVLRGAAKRLIIDLVDVESVLLERTADLHGFPISMMFRRWARASAEMESRLLADYDTVLVTSDVDAKRIPVQSTVYPNTVPLVPCPSSRVKRRPNELVFSGNWEYHPNISGTRWFVENLWPQIKHQCPGVRCRFVGRNDHGIRNLISSDPDLIATGPVGDAVEAIAESSVAIVPLLNGSGTRLKIIEAWAAAVPVVSTQIGAEGLPGVPGEHLIIADEPHDFATAVVNLLQDSRSQYALGSAGRHLYERELTWASAWTRLEKLGL